jgi:adenine-specific DNA methylase
MIKSFIETQFPVSKVSKESYKERMANYSQTLTGLGKWWGRKPLILVRSAIIGLLMPASENPTKDREVFLKILTMDEEGLWQRKAKLITLKEVYKRLDPGEREQWFQKISTEEKPKLKKGTTKEQREELQRIVFMPLSYDEKLQYCNRPEQINGPSEKAWVEINAHLKTSACNIQELVCQLGESQFGHVPRVGDAFCGGGSVPFEAARLGCEAYGSDLNPVAALLTWAALNIVGGGETVAKEVRQAQQEVFDAVDRQITEWGIEHNNEGHRADAYLYCNEVVCPECGWKVPLAPSWVIGEKTRCVARLVPDEAGKRFALLIESGVSSEKMDEAKKAGTIKNSALVCPHCPRSTPMAMLRGDRRGCDGNQYGLRMWENDDIVPRPDDIFQERLYCIRWVDTWEDDEGKIITERYYQAPDKDDLRKEKFVLELLQERFDEWQEKGYIPSRRIEPGDKTDEPIRTRGWTHWHHLFNPRQLLTLGLFFEEVMSIKTASKDVITAVLLLTSRCCDYNAKLSRWHSHGANEKSEQVFSDQALNTLFEYGVRAVNSLSSAFFTSWPAVKLAKDVIIKPIDARNISCSSDIWLTDPPYADAINYHELSEFFLAWYGKHIPKLFPDWYTDSKRALAITGSDENFRKSMVDSYRNLAEHMPDNGVQIVMFTHQDAGVWADLALILWAAGLRVTAAWCIATETDSALKEGNYVQGTVLLVLRKQTSDETAFTDEIYPQINEEVKIQLNEMLALEDQEDPNFSDTDYQLAAYAAALRVLTRYRNIEDIDVAGELARPRQRGEQSPVVDIINQAVKIACDYLVPKGIETFIWKNLTPDERFYLKGLEHESHGEYRSGAYQELARGFGLREYRSFFSGSRANQTRLKTASEFATRQLEGTGFGATLVRQILFAVSESVRSGETADGRNWFRNELKERYWSERQTIIQLLHYLAALGRNKNMPQWLDDADAARLLAGAVENDHI